MNSKYKVQADVNTSERKLKEKEIWTPTNRPVLERRNAVVYRNFEDYNKSHSALETYGKRAIYGGENETIYRCQRCCFSEQTDKSSTYNEKKCKSCLYRSYIYCLKCHLCSLCCRK